MISAPDSASPSTTTGINELIVVDHNHNSYSVSELLITRPGDGGTFYFYNGLEGAFLRGELFRGWALF